MNYVGKRVAIRQGSLFYSSHKRFEGIARRLRTRLVVTIEYQFTGQQPWVQWRSGQHWCWTDAQNVIEIDEHGLPVDFSAPQCAQEIGTASRRGDDTEISRDIINRNWGKYWGPR